MRKSILLVLLAFLTITFLTAVAFSKAKKEESISKPSHFQKSEPAVGPEVFPEVVLPKPKPVRPTMEDFQNLHQMRGKALPTGLPEAVEFLDMAEREPLTQCIIGNLVSPCCYYYPAGSDYLACWGVVGVATFNDPDKTTLFAPCPYPIFPFMAKDVRFSIAGYPASCQFQLQPEIRSAVYIDGCPYPGDSLLAGPIYTIDHIGGNMYQYLSLGDSVCLYEPWFAVMWFHNTDEFGDTNQYCSPPYPDPASPLFDNSGTKCQTYWTSLLFGSPPSWYEILEYGIGSGTWDVRTRGYHTPENTCPPPVDPWYFKDSYEPYAPCGVPDFDQNQMPPAFCGPTAGANSIWWFASRGDFPPSWGGLTPADVPALINEIAILAGTSPTYGTECDSLEEALLQVIKNHAGWWFAETTVYMPNFWYLQKNLRLCEDIILLLGFWQTPDGGTTWNRFGGHFVTLAGIDIFNYAFAFSDPALDNFEFGGGPGQLCGVHTPANDPIDHNSGITSYDYYSVAWPSSSPGGYLYLPDYVVEWADFQDQNFRTEHHTYQGTYNPALPVVVEVEQAIVVSPGQKELTGEVSGSEVYEVDNNYGGIADGEFEVNFGGTWVNGGYYGSYILGTEQADLNCSYGDYYPSQAFEPLSPPVWDTFSVTGSTGPYLVEQLTLEFQHSIMPDLYITEYVFGFWVPEGGTIDCEYVFEHVFVIENQGVPITGLQTGIINDFDIGSANACEVDYVQQYQTMWMYQPAAPDTVFGMTKVPAVVGDVAITGWGTDNNDRIYDGQYHDSLKYWMENLGWGVDNPGTYTDKSWVIADTPFDLGTGELRIDKWLKWGYDGPVGTGGDANLRHFLYNILHQQGYFRGDVNHDRRLSISDLVYLISYLYKSGAQPYEFVDQGDVNFDQSVDVADIVYLINFIFRQGPAPIDRNRFLSESPYVDPLHKALGTREPGLFGDPDWRNLGR